MLQDIDLAYDRTGALTTSRSLKVAGALTVAGSPVSAPSVPQPGDHALAAWSYDPSFALSGLTPTLGTVYLSAVYLRQAATISKCWFMLGTAAGTPTAGQNWAGLINASGTVLSTASLDTVVTGSNTPKFGTLSTPQSVAAGMYWVALLFNGATAPVVYKTAAPFLGFGTVNQAAAAYRYATAGTGQTALNNITPASNGQGQSIWVAVS